MANKRFIHSSYASALFSLAKESGEITECQNDLSSFASLFDECEPLQKSLKSYSIDYEQKSSLIDLSTKGFPTNLVSFLKILARDHLYGRFADIVREFDSLANEELGVKEGLAYSVAPLSKEEIAKIEKAIGDRLGGKIHLINKVEPSLIGGVKVAIDGKIFDGTVSAKIENMRKALLGGAK